MFGSLDISVSALVAQRGRMETIAANIANKDSLYDADGNYAPYKRRVPIFATGDPTSGSSEGVHLKKIAISDDPYKLIYSPDHPNADEKGYLKVPNIDSTMEMVNALDASRAYEANITAAEATKSMLQSSLRIIG